MRKLRVAAFAALSIFVCGCVEGEVVYTLNPDGSGKADIDLVMAPSGLALDRAFGGDKANDDIDEMARKLVARELVKAKSEGITAWSNVRGEFIKDGRFRFRATAYFKRLEDAELGPFGKLRLVRADDGTLTLSPKPKDEPLRKKAAPPNFAKMTEAEWSKFLFLQRIEGQGTKAFVTSFLADVKFNTTIRMPGEITAIKGCKSVDKNSAGIELDGNAVITEFKRVQSLTDAELRKMYLDGKSPDFSEEGAFESMMFGGQPSVTVAKPTGQAFDYEKEVAAAIAGNPELRKRYNISEFSRLPGDPETKLPGIPKLKEPPPLPPPPPKLPPPPPKLKD